MGLIGAPHGGATAGALPWCRHALAWRCVLSLVVVAVVGCNDHAINPYEASVAVAPEERFTQRELRPVDILFVVDNSRSMCEEQIALQRSFDQFVAIMADANADFRLGVITTDMVDLSRGLGQLQRSPGSFAQNLASCSAELPDLSHCAEALPRGFLSASDYALDGADTDRLAEVTRLQRDFGCIALTGIDGDPTEMGFGALLSALASPELAELRRPGALLAIVFVTDENDCSDGTVGAAHGPVYALGDEGCELNRNLEDACLYAAADTWDEAGVLAPFEGEALTLNGETQSARQWCVDGDRDAVAALGGALAVDCGGTACSSLLLPRAGVFEALLRHVRDTNGTTDDAAAARDLIIAAIVNPDGGVRYATGPTSWCGTAGTQGYRYQALAEMVAPDRRVIAPICDLATGQPVDFGEPLARIAAVLVSAITETCLQHAPMRCEPADARPDGGCRPGARCCPEGQACSQVFLEGTEFEYHLCGGFRIEVQQRTQAGGLQRLVEGQDFEVDYRSETCLQQTGSPVRVVFTRPPPAGSEVGIVYAGGVLPLFE